MFPFLVVSKHLRIASVSVVIPVLFPITEVDHPLGQYSYKHYKVRVRTI